MGTKATNALRPEWEPLLGRIAGREGAMNLDSVATSHPIVQKIESVEQISQAFDPITYRKGEAVLRMLEDYVGEDVWRQGVRDYIATYRLKNTVTDNLWEKVEHAAGKPVTAIAHDFTLQAGVPLIRVEAAECRDGNTNVTLRQEEFSRDEVNKKPLKWRVPVIASTLGGAEVRTLEAIQRKPVKAVVVSFFLRFGQAGNSGLIQTYMISFMTLTLALQKSLSANVVIVSSLVGFLTIPLVGWLGDRFGRRRMYIICTSAALVVIVPTMLAIDSKDLVWVFVGYVVLHNVAVLSLASLENCSIPEIFGARNRYTLTAVVREIAAVIATGIGPVVVAAWVAAVTGSPIPIMVMLGLYSLAALIAAVWAKDWTGRDLTDPLPAM
jgi:hypothetical protein